MTAQTLGHYRIVREIGRGGMGVVYEGYDDRLDRRVAIKVIDMPEDASIPEETRQELIGRFATEAKAIARLSHPHIVAVYDIGQQDGRHYMVQELLQGRSLAQMLQNQGPLPVDLVVHAIRQVCQALDYVHQQGIIHRDIKPGNIVLLDSGVAKLMDFGIARLGQASTGMTKAGSILGSLLYISPEQLVHAGKVDGRADLYSLGVTLYELLTGHLPFKGDNVGALVMAIMQGQLTPPRLLRPDIPQGLEAVILKAMAREPDGRFARASDMADALGGEAPGSATSAGGAPAVMRDSGPGISTVTGIMEFSLQESGEALTNFALVQRVAGIWPREELTKKSVVDVLYHAMLEGETRVFVVNGDIMLLVYQGLLVGAVSADDQVAQGAYERLGHAQNFTVTMLTPPEEHLPWVGILSAMIGGAKSTNQLVTRSTEEAVHFYDALKKEGFTGFIRQADGNQVRYQAYVDGERAFAVSFPDPYSEEERGGQEIEAFSPRWGLVGPSLRQAMTETSLDVVTKSINRPSLKQLAAQKDSKVSPETLEEAVRNTEVNVLGGAEKTVTLGTTWSARYHDLVRELPTGRLTRWLVGELLSQLARSPQFAAARGNFAWIWQLKSIRQGQKIKGSLVNASFDWVAYDGQDQLVAVARWVRVATPAELQSLVQDVTQLKTDHEQLKAAILVATEGIDDEVVRQVDRASTRPLLFGSGQKGFISTKKGGGFLVQVVADGGADFQWVAPVLL